MVDFNHTTSEDVSFPFSNSACFDIGLHLCFFRIASYFIDHN